MKVKIPIYKKVLTKSEVEVDIQKVIDKLLLKNQDIIVDSLIDALNEDMEEYVIEGEGLMARAICHELEHLDGMIFLDKAIEELSVV